MSFLLIELSRLITGKSAVVRKEYKLQCPVANIILKSLQALPIIPTIYYLQGTWVCTGRSRLFLNDS